MTQAPEIARPDVMSTIPEGVTPERHAKAVERANVYVAGHITGLEGREDEFKAAMIDVVRTLTHTKGYPHEVNDALVKSWLSGIRFAVKHDLMDEWVQDSVEVMRPVLMRMRKIAEESGNREVYLEAIAGWSTCHHQLVIAETHKAPGKRWFLSPFKTALDAGKHIGQFDFDEKFVVDEFFAKRARGHAQIMGVEVEIPPFDPETRIIEITLLD
jgi:hypothetical protein